MNLNFTSKHTFCRFERAIKTTFVLALFASEILTAHAAEGIWKDVTKSQMTGTGKNYIVPQKFRSLSFDMNALKSYLSQAPMEIVGGNYSKNFYFTFPMPDGTNQKFYIVETFVMHPDLAAKFPEIKTFVGQGIDDPSATVRLDFTPTGFHAMILSASGSYFIDPYFFKETTYYISYDKLDYIPSRVIPACSAYKENAFDNSIDGQQFAQSFQPVTTPVLNKSIGTELREYSLALAADGEYSQFHGGTKALALAAMVTSMNRVDGIYERELDIRLTLVPNDTLLIYLNPSSDPYDNTSISSMLPANQTTINSVIGLFNYDIGHVFSTCPDGGLATLGCVCNGSTKARAATGSPSPVGDPYDVDYVAHEMGHQFGGNHTFNCLTGACSNSTRVPNSAYEPGSGSTIMAYAGICAGPTFNNDLQSHSDAMFHPKSFDEITNFTHPPAAGNVCATVTATGNNPPIIYAGPNYIVPCSTAFKLTGNASDPDGDPITYSWEEYDHGSACNYNAPVDSAPSLRSFLPTTNPYRIFPKLAKLLSPIVVSKGETLPTYARNMKFKLTCRDNKFGGGGVTNNDTLVQVDFINTGAPFVITSPNTSGISYPATSFQTVTWNVSGTDVAPINTPLVDIFLSTDGGLTFPTQIGYNVPNNGSYSWWTPSTPVSQGRLWVQGTGNIFLDINDYNFSVFVGIEENDLSHSISVYPNPGNDLFAFAMDNNYFGNVKITVFDKLSKKVSEQFANKQSKSFNCKLDAKHFESGVYFVEFTFDSGKAVKRVIKL